MSRIDTLLDRMIAVLPLPEPPTGPRTARIRLRAVAIAGPIGTVPAHEEQVGYAIQAMQEGAHLVRVDGNPTNWDLTTAATWRFSPALDATQGAQNAWLDYWGSTLQQPRISGEPDSSYAPRILAYCIAPITTNVGMAAAIDRGLGITGTIVQEANDFFTIIRANEGYQANDQIQANNAPGLTDTPWASFIVKLPQQPPYPYDYGTVETIANQSKAAGTRLVGVYLIEAVIVTAPSTAAVGATNTASAVGPAGSTYTWSITNGTILTGQGTDTITYTCDAGGYTTVTATATPPTGPTVSGSATTYGYAAPDATITAGPYFFAGTFNASASLGAQPPGSVITWTGTNIRIQSGQGTATLTFDVGASGTSTSLQATVTTPGGSDTKTEQLKVVPYTSTAAHTTASLVPATGPTVGYEDFTIDLGWQYVLQAIQTDYPALVRVYETAAARAADAGRGFTTDPTTDPTLQTVIVFEGETSPTELAFTLEHPVTATNGDTPRSQTAYIRIYNMDSVSRAITLTITRTETQISNSF